jgi:hypothetical protein
MVKQEVMNIIQKIMGGAVEPTIYIGAAVVMGIMVGIACAATENLAVSGQSGTVLKYIVVHADSDKRERVEKTLEE